MALKPLFQRKPLMDTKKAPLPLKQTLIKGKVEDKLRALSKETLAQGLDAYGLRALSGAAYLLEDEELMAACGKAMDESALFSGREMSVMDGLNLAMAVIPRYEKNTDKALLEPLMHLAKRLDNTLESGLLMNPGEAVELVLWLYNVTGKKGLLNLVATLRQKALDWTSVLSTFEVVKPLDKMIPLSELEEGIKKENGDVAGFYTRRYAIGHGETLARNLKTPALFALYSGNGKEMEAPMAGYKKMMRYHGIPGGVFTAAPYLSGSNPEKGVSYQAAGEMAYSLATVARVDETAFDALEKVALNCLMKYEENGPCAAYVLKGLVAYARAAASVYADDTLKIDLLIQGEFKFKTENGKVKVRTKVTDEAFTLKVTASEEKKQVIKVRVPAWAGDAFAQIGEEPGIEKNSKGVITIQREFGKAPTDIDIKLYCEKTAHKGYRETEYFEYGPYVLSGEA